MNSYKKIRAGGLLRAFHFLLPLKHKLDFLIDGYLHSSVPLAIRYNGDFFVCTPVTDMNRPTVSELIWEGIGSQPERSLIKEVYRKLKPNSSFVDIGGNIGTFTWQVAAKCGRVDIFEPIPRLNKVIEDSIEFNRVTNVRLIKKALGDHDHVVEMLDNNNSSVVTGGEGEKTLKIPVATIDGELADITGLDLVKIDVEGFEFKVLQGGRQTIERLKPDLLVELHPGFIIKYGDTHQGVLDLIEEMGYSIAYYSFLDELRHSRFQRIVNRWLGNPGKIFANRKEFEMDVKKSPELSSYHLYCQPIKSN